MYQAPVEDGSESLDISGFFGGTFSTYHPSFSSPNPACSVWPDLRHSRGSTVCYAWAGKIAVYTPGTAAVRQRAAETGRRTILCPAVEQRPETSGTRENKKCSGHKHRCPSRHPAADSSRDRSCNSYVPTAGRYGIADRSCAVSSLFLPLRGPALSGHSLCVLA